MYGALCTGAEVSSNLSLVILSTVNPINILVLKLAGRRAAIGRGCVISAWMYTLRFYGNMSYLAYVPSEFLMQMYA